MPVVGENARRALKQYLKRCEEGGLPEKDALKRWSARQTFSSPATRACCEFLDVMGHKRHVVYADLLEVLQSQLLVRIQTVLDTDSQSGEEMLIAERLFPAIQDAAYALKVPSLRPSAVALLSSYFRAQQRRRMTSTIDTLPPIDDSIGAKSLRSWMPVTAPHIVQEVHGSRETAVLMSIVQLANDDKELEQFCSLLGSVSFRSLFWPIAPHWLLQVLLKYLIPAILRIHKVSLQPPEDDSSTHTGNEELKSLTTIVTSSSYAYAFFCAVIEDAYVCSFLPSLQAHSRNTAEQPEELTDFLSTFITAPQSKKREPESRIPSLRVEVLMMSAKENILKPAELDPLGHAIITVMESLSAITEEINDFGTLRYQELIGGKLGGLINLKVTSTEDFATISFILSHPPYLLLLSELFVSLQASLSETDMITKVSTSTKAVDFVLGMIFISLSFPIIQSSIRSGRRLKRSKRRQPDGDIAEISTISKRRRRKSSLSSSPIDTDEFETSSRSSILENSTTLLNQTIINDSSFIDYNQQQQNVLTLGFIIQQLKLMAPPCNLSSQGNTVLLRNSLLRELRKCLVNLRPITYKFIRALSRVLSPDPDVEHSNLLMPRIVERKQLLTKLSEAFRHSVLTHGIIVSSECKKQNHDKTTFHEKGEFIDDETEKIKSKISYVKSRTTNETTSEFVKSNDNYSINQQQQAAAILTVATPEADSGGGVENISLSSGQDIQRRRFGIDRRLLTTILTGVLRCGIVFPALEHLISFVVQTIGDRAPSQMIEDVSSILIGERSQLDWHELSCNIRLIFRHMILPEAEQYHMNQLINNCESSYQDLTEMFYRLDCIAAIIQVSNFEYILSKFGTRMNLSLIDEHDRSLFTKIHEFSKRILNDAVSKDLFLWHERLAVTEGLLAANDRHSRA